MLSYVEGVTLVSPNVKSLFAAKGIRIPLRVKEIAILASAEEALKGGTSAKGTSYEERARVTGSVVEYTDTTVVITPPSGDSVQLPNLPVPVYTRPIRQVAKEVAFLAARFDINAGELVYVAPLEVLTKMWTAKAAFSPQRLDAVKSVLTSILKTFKNSIFAESVTLKGMAFFDHLNDALQNCAMTDLYALQTTIAQCFPAIQRVGTGWQVEQVAQGPAVPDDSWDIVRRKNVATADLTAYDEFKRVTGAPPVYVNENIPASHVWTSKKAASMESNCFDYRKAVAVWGGNKRGVGKIATFFNYAPRQSKTLRHVNAILMMIKSLPATTAVDVRCETSEQPLIRAALEGTEYTNVRYLFAETAKGLPVDATIIFKPTPNAVRVSVDVASDIPDVQKDYKVENARKILTLAFGQFKSRMSTAERFITVTQAFSADFFDEQEGLKVFPFPSAHSMESVVTNCDINAIHCPHRAKSLVPTTLSAWVAKVHEDIVAMNVFFLKPRPTTSWIGRFFTFKGKPLEWTGDSWKYKPAEEMYVHPTVTTRKVTRKTDDEHDVQPSGQAVAEEPDIPLARPRKLVSRKTDDDDDDRRPALDANSSVVPQDAPAQDEPEQDLTG